MNTTPRVPAINSSDFEEIKCYLCGKKDYKHFTVAEDDLGGRPGKFMFVTCNQCGLGYQNPRLNINKISEYYDDEYIAHRKKTNWGPLTPLYRWAMQRHDKQKVKISSKYIEINQKTRALDIGCGAGTFLLMLKEKFSSDVTGVDFKDLNSLPGFDKIDFKQGLFYEQNFYKRKFDLITMWHFLEHDYEPSRTLKLAKELLTETGRIIIEVPRLDSLSFKLYKERWPGLQAPQHTLLFNKETLLAMAEKSGREVIDYLPYGAFPSYFYLFTGFAFKLLKGKGLNLSRAILPYFIGNFLLAPLLLFERRFNLAMQTIILGIKDHK